MSTREIAEPAGIRQARTFPASWYGSPYHHERELLRVWSARWVCIGDEFDMPAPGSSCALTVGRSPVLLVRDRDGELRAFFNHSLKPVGLTTWRRWVFVHVDATAAPPDFGPLGAAIDAFQLEAMEVALSESDERAFNWKVLLENYSENHHTPFVHPEIDNSSSHDYPMVSDGLVLYAWDRPLHPDDEAGRAMATLLPGEPGWNAVATAPTGQPYDRGNYLTVWPNLMLNVFPDAALAMWAEPLSGNRTIVHRRLYVRPGSDSAAVAANIAAHRLVHQQDVEICLRVQRSHDAGINADGVPATVEERGVFWLHQHLRTAFAHDGCL